ncbi:MAG TPA: GumC family protein [Caulobacter sp.]|nr:GumC family protein [Caulobacter sp.]
MSSQSAWRTIPHDPPAAAGWASRPRYAPSDFITLLWRERGLMLGVFLVILALGVVFAMTLKKAYSAESSILIQLGQEYVYEPRAGDAGRGAVPDTDSLVQSEVEILQSGQLRERVLRRIGLGVVYPDLAEKYAAASPADKAVLMAKAIDSMGRKLSVGSAPANPVVRVSFEHDDPVMAARVVNTLLEEYLVYRRSVLIHPTSPVFERQRVMFEEQLQQADAAYQDFLTTNDIGDFAAQKTAATQLIGQIEAQRYAAEVTLQDRQARLAVLDGQLAQVTPEIGLYRDIDASASSRLAALRLQREEMLSRYRPEADPVRDIEAQIAQLEAGVSAGRTATDGARRIGVNPVHQTLQTERIQTAAEIAALQQSLSAYAAQAAKATEQLQRLATLEPQFQALTMDRDVLQSSVRDFTVRERQDQASRQIASESNDNIRIVDRATPATKGKSLRKPVAMLAFLFGAFSALCAGLVRMFLRPGLPTRASAQRTLDLPVLGTAPVKLR